jgi:hypothetical protein
MKTIMLSIVALMTLAGAANAADISANTLKADTNSVAEWCKPDYGH